MSTIALKGRTFTESKNKVSVGKKIAEYVKATYVEFMPEIVCGILAMSGNTNSFRMYQMLKK